MQKFRLDKKTIIYSIFYAVLIIDFLLVLPYQAKKLVGFRSKVGSLRRSIDEFNRDAGSKDKFITEQEEIGIELMNLEEKIIDSQDRSTLLAYISNNAKKNAVDILEITSGEAQQETKDDSGTAEFIHLPIKIEAKADFHSLAQFLNSLERGSYFLEVKGLTVRGNAPYHRVEIMVNALLRQAM